MIRKVMEGQQDRYYILDSVLFVIHISHHSSTGIGPYRVLYSKDPELPFEYADKQKAHGIDSDVDSDSESDQCSQSNEGIDQFLETFQN